jgi:glycosyltransferase EpsD
MVLINREDFELCRRLFKTRTAQIDGVGVNLGKFHIGEESERNARRLENGFSPDEFLVICVAQLIPRKNLEWLITSFVNLAKIHPEVRLVLVGDGPLRGRLEIVLAEKDATRYVKMLGYRTDVNLLYRMADLLVSTSKQEGFPINIVEGMASGLPCLCSDIRGHRDIAEKSVSVVLFDPNDYSDFERKFQGLYETSGMRSGESIAAAAEQFSVQHSVSQMKALYELAQSEPL